MTNLDYYMLNSATKLFTSVNIVDLLHLFLSYSVLSRAIILPCMVRTAQKCVFTLLLLPVPVINSNHDSNNKNIQWHYEPHCLVWFIVWNKMWFTLILLNSCYDCSLEEGNYAIYLGGKQNNHSVEKCHYFNICLGLKKECFMFYVKLWYIQY